MFCAPGLTEKDSGISKSDADSRAGAAKQIHRHLHMASVIKGPVSEGDEPKRHKAGHQGLGKDGHPPVFMLIFTLGFERKQLARLEFQNAVGTLEQSLFWECYALSFSEGPIFHQN